VQQNDFLEELEQSGPHKFIEGFVAGAMWWEYKKTGYRMWQGDQKAASTVAFRRLAETDGGELDEANPNRFLAGFIEGAKWWEFHKYDRAMNHTDQELAKREAQRRQLPAHDAS
jgi:hypothetical protein